MNVYRAINKFNKTNQRIQLGSVRFMRNHWCRDDIKKKVPHCTPISNRQMKVIKDYWNSLGVPESQIDYRWFEFYNTFCQDKSTLKYYIPDNWFYCYVDLFFSDYKKAEIFDDKSLYDLLFYDVNRPSTIARSIRGVFVDENYSIISYQDVLDKCKNANNGIVIKNCVESYGGFGILFWDPSKSINQLEEYLKNFEIAVIQKVLCQHPELKKIHPISVNTLKIMTLLFEGKVHVLPIVLRMGQGDSRVDNISSGGIFSGIQKDGHLMPMGYDYRNNIFDRHPQGLRFSDFIVPGYYESINLVKRLAPRLSGISKLISWDIAILPTEDPVIIETNLTAGAVDIHQIAHGPIFGELTTSVIKHIINHKPFWLR